MICQGRRLKHNAHGRDITRFWESISVSEGWNDGWDALVYGEVSTEMKTNLLITY